MTDTPEYISLLDAATAIDKKKSTVLRRIKHKDVSKRILAHQNDSGEWQVNLHSLSQHYRLTNDGMAYIEERHATGASLHSDADLKPRTTSATPSFAGSNVKFEAEIKLLEERISSRNETIIDLRKDKDRLSGQVEQFAETINRQTLLITAREADSDISGLQPRKSSLLTAAVAAVLVIAAVGAVAITLAPKQFSSLLTNATVMSKYTPVSKASQVPIEPHEVFFSIRGQICRLRALWARNLPQAP